MDFVIAWLWYLLAFVAGSALTWSIAIAVIKPTSAAQAMAQRAGPPETGAP